MKSCVLQRREKTKQKQPTLNIFHKNKNKLAMFHISFMKFQQHSAAKNSHTGLVNSANAFK